jgi:hypothetical protein
MKNSDLKQKQQVCTYTQPTIPSETHARQEWRRIAAILRKAPNRPLHAAEGAHTATHHSPCTPRHTYIQERRRIAAILRQPPNRPLHAEERAILWRFRFSLQQEMRALTKFLQCVDWGDAMEGRQVGCTR